MARRKTTVVYLFHFVVRFKHAGHYLGSTVDLDNRMAEYARRSGVNIFMQKALDSGVQLRLVALFYPAEDVTGYTLERAMKGAPRGNGHKGSLARFCPICRDEQ